MKGCFIALAIPLVLGAAIVKGEDAPWPNDMYYHHHPNKAMAMAADNDGRTSLYNDMYYHHHPNKAMAANSGTPIRQSNEEGAVFPNDMYYHHHPNKAFAASKGYGGYSPRLAAENTDGRTSLYNDMYYHHHPNKI